MECGPRRFSAMWFRQIWPSRLMMNSVRMAAGLKALSFCSYGFNCLFRHRYSESDTRSALTAATVAACNNLRSKTGAPTRTYVPATVEGSLLQRFFRSIPLLDAGLSSIRLNCICCSLLLFLWLSAWPGHIIQLISFDRLLSSSDTPY